jgi:hypothetical protein
MLGQDWMSRQRCIVVSKLGDTSSVSILFNKLFMTLRYESVHVVREKLADNFCFEKNTSVITDKLSS